MSGPDTDTHPSLSTGIHDGAQRGSPRFLTLADVADALNISGAQVYALVRRGELRGIKIGGRGQWRVEVSELERYINAMYDEAARFVDEHPFTGETLLRD